MAVAGSSRMMSGRPLLGLKVLDMSRVLAGPWCTMLLADHGATVLKVERPGVGDETRSWGPPFVGFSGEGGPNKKNSLSTYFLSVNRGKKSLAVDLNNQQGLDICRQLAVDWADVIVENFKPGTMEHFGLDYESLRKQNRSIVYCSVTGFGPSGPLSDQPGYDLIISGSYGLMSITGSEEEPAKVGVASTDILTGTLAYSGIMTALYQRQQTAEGSKVDVSLMETQLASLVNIASSALNTTDETWPRPKRWGTAHESVVPYQAFDCRKNIDGNSDERQYILVGAGNNIQFQKLCNAIGRSDLANDLRYETNADRVQHRDELVSHLKEIFLTKSRDDWVSVLKDKGFPVGPLRTVNEGFECEQARHRGMVETTKHPVVGTIRLPRTPISISSSTSTDTRSSSFSSSRILPPPMLGEHTEEILTNILGFDLDDINKLEADKAIECWYP